MSIGESQRTIPNDQISNQKYQIANMNYNMASGEKPPGQFNANKKTPRYLTTVCWRLARIGSGLSRLNWLGSGSAWSARLGSGWQQWLGRPGLAWPDLDWLRLGLAWLGLAWPGLDSAGLAWLGLAWPGLAWSGLAWPGPSSLDFGEPSPVPHQS